MNFTSIIKNYSNFFSIWNRTILFSLFFPSVVKNSQPYKYKCYKEDIFITDFLLVSYDWTLPIRAWKHGNVIYNNSNVIYTVTILHDFTFFITSNHLLWYGITGSAPAIVFMKNTNYTLLIIFIYYNLEHWNLWKVKITIHLLCKV